MEFDCKEISISDEGFGFQVTFSENLDLGEELENMSLEEFEESFGKYLLLQRSFPEDDYDSDDLYFETHDENLNGNIDKCIISLSKLSFKLSFDSKTIDISIFPSDNEFSELKRILPLIINNQGELIIKD